MAFLVSILFVRDVRSSSRVGSRVIALCEAFLIRKVFSFWVPKGSNPVIVNLRGFIAFSALCLDHWVVMGALAEVWVSSCGRGRGSAMV